MASKDLDIAGAAWDSIVPDDLFRIDDAPDELKKDEPLPIHRQHGPADLRDRYEMIPHSQIEIWEANPGAGERTINVEGLRDNILNNRMSGGGINGTGINQVLTVKPHPTKENKYILADGERRWRATDGTAVTELPCIITHITEGESVEFAISVDLHNAEWSPVQAGKALLDFMAGASHDEIKRNEKETAKYFGVSIGFIKNRTRAAQAPADLQQMAESRPDSMSHIEYLEQVENPRKRRDLIKQVLAGASVKAISQQVAEINKKTPPPSHAAPRANLTAVPSLPPRPAFEGFDYSPPAPSQSTLTSRSIVVNEAAPDYAAMAQQATQLWQQVAESAEYSEVEDAVRSTLSAIATLKKRSVKAA